VLAAAMTTLSQKIIRPQRIIIINDSDNDSLHTNHEHVQVHSRPNDGFICQWYVMFIVHHSTSSVYASSLSEIYWCLHLPIGIDCIILTLPQPITAHTLLRNFADEAESLQATQCVPDDRPRPVRDGVRFRFNLEKSDSLCVDSKSNLYEYGQYNGVADASDCAEACVNEVTSSMAAEVRGYEYGCNDRVCRCLYDAGTLDDRSSSRNGFNSINRKYVGTGSITGTTSEAAYVCFKLVGAELEEEALDLLLGMN
jgi:hypothetical protein